MAYDERHVEHVHEHSGTSSGVIAALIILAAAVIGLGIVLFINRSNNGNVGTQQPAAVPQTTTSQQPATQPPVVVQERGAAPAAGRTTVVTVPNDAAIQADVDRRIANAAVLSRLGITTTVSNGRVVLVGNVNNRDLRAQAESLARAVSGVRTIDNQIIVVTTRP